MFKITESVYCIYKKAMTEKRFYAGIIYTGPLGTIPVSDVHHESGHGGRVFSRRLYTGGSRG